MSTTKSIEISNLQYVPSKITITVGDSVKWVNKDAMTHTATRTDSPAFDTGPLKQNETSEEIQFTESSDENGFKYFCKPHPFMEGYVVVMAVEKSK